MKLSDLPALLFEENLEEDPSAEAWVESEEPEVDPAVKEEGAGIAAFKESPPLRSLKIFASGESGESFNIATKTKTSKWSD